MLENITSEEIKNQFKTNKKVKMTTYAIGGVIVLIAGFFAYKQFIVKPKEEKSRDAYWVGMNYVMQDSTELAISELTSVVKKYDGYTGGEIAQYLLGGQYLKKGDLKNAIDNLEDVDVNDTYVSAMSLGLLGDAYSDSKDYKKAIAKYEDAARKNENEFTTPMYLFKAGLCAEELKDYNKATELYTEIKDDYPRFGQKKTIDKYIARTSNQAVK